MAKERGKEWEEYDNAVRWMTITFAIAVVVTVVFMYIAPNSGIFYAKRYFQKECGNSRFVFEKVFCGLWLFVGLVSEMVQKGLPLQRRVSRIDATGTDQFMMVLPVI